MAIHILWPMSIFCGQWCVYYVVGVHILRSVSILCGRCPYSVAGGCPYYVVGVHTLEPHYNTVFGVHSVISVITE